MATVTVRGLDDAVVRRLEARAAANNRSLEAELRRILETAVAERDYQARRERSPSIRTSSALSRAGTVIRRRRT